MLLTGNYRCVTRERAIDIKDAVHRGVALGLQLGPWRVREARSVAERSGAIREIRCRRDGPSAAFLRGAGAV
jgi:hypothetical protein